MDLWKKMMVGTLALSMVAGGGASAFAKHDRDWKGKDDDKRWENKFVRGDWDDDDDDEDKEYKGKVQIDFKKNGEIRLKFKDVEEEAAWALRYIAELAARGVFTGYEDGTFRPNQTVNRIEAITAAVRLMGLRAQAESEVEMSTELQFKDADKIEKKYPWAVGYVAVAAENDLFIETDTEVQPDRPADRLWAAILLVKALGLENEAKAKMNDELSFKDKKEIPAGAVGYIAVAVEKGLITGYENNTFRPNKPITRAELAALLDRTGDQDPDQNNTQVSGTVTAVSAGKLTITKDGKATQYNVSSNVSVVRDSKMVELDDLLPGDKVEAVVLNGAVVFITVTQAATAPDNNGEVSGTVTAVSAGKVTITKDGTATQYNVSSHASIVRNNALVALDELKSGDKVTAVISNGTVVFITVTEAVTAPEQNGQISGTVTAVSAGKVTITNNGKATQYNVSANVNVVRNNSVANLEVLLPGDKVNALVSNGQIVFITVTEAVSDDNNAVYEVEGKYQGHTVSGGNLATISVTTEVYGNPTTRIYNVADDVVINGGNAFSLVEGETDIGLIIINQLVSVINIK